MFLRLFYARFRFQELQAYLSFLCVVALIRHERADNRCIVYRQRQKANLCTEKNSTVYNTKLSERRFFARVAMNFIFMYSFIIFYKFALCGHFFALNFDFFHILSKIFNIIRLISSLSFVLKNSPVTVL